MLQHCYAVPQSNEDTPDLMAIMSLPLSSKYNSPDPTLGSSRWEQAGGRVSLLNQGCGPG